MGAGQSTSQSHVPTRGLHVLRVTPSSPAFHSNIEPFFDFVVGFEGDSLSEENAIDASELERIVESHENRTLNLLVWNSKSQLTRGLSMRLCQPETASDNVWHVLDVIEGSPAESAGLVPMGDWILGWSGGVLTAENDFYDLVEAHIDKPLRVYVYSYDFEIPPQPEDRVPGTIPPELQEMGDEYGHQDLFVPADIDESQHTQGRIANRQHNSWYQDSIPKSNDAHGETRAVHKQHSHDHGGSSLQ
ncbi:Golgi reassembly-stacking protein 2 [Psilocybe cubensis]|uniref:Golgi reassembly-stacking protein 2 n=1 Tax=Psilocybe cubensis TaxID=181762 RepID=A0ACB8GYL0_PSICU|nr:Golgi reassembly-stacking protein 2 [Psilocybe cubensis]KAH9480517.1 Golgi reassembly-stacking protein 2 [Psilocybe cubensis]